MENITNLITNLVALLTAIAALIVAFYKAKEDVKTAIPKKIKGQVLIDSEITNEIENLKEYLIADRVQIYDFHNGGHYANGRSALKTSCSYEVVRSRNKGASKRASSSSFELYSKIY